MTDRIATLSRDAVAKSNTVSTEGGRLRESVFPGLILGPENQLVSYALGLHGDMSRNPETGDRPPGFDFVPLTFYAPSGYGKSQLLQTMAEVWRDGSSTEDAMLIDATDFARGYAQAVKLDDVQRFQQRFQRVGLLLVDNVNDLRKKPGAQHQLSTTIDHRQRQARPTVLTSRLKLHAAGLTGRLVSRLASGLCIPLELPGPQTTASVLAQLCQARRIVMTPAAVRRVCEHKPMSIPHLTGLVNRLTRLQGLVDETLADSCSDAATDGLTTIDEDDVEQILNTTPADQIDAKRVIRVTANYFGVQHRNLTCKSRRKMDVLARSVAMYLIREHTEFSFQQIGNWFGKRDHTTVMHACKKIAHDRSADPATRNAITDIEQRLQIRQ